jgi:thymidylate kinase
MLTAIEGINASGKQAQASLFAERCREEDFARVMLPLPRFSGAHSCAALDALNDDAVVLTCI